MEPDYIRRAFGSVIAREREEANFKQRPFARMTGISNSHLRSIESGDVSPTLVTICKIAEALDMAPQSLVAQACDLAQTLEHQTHVTEQEA